jgi:hypothetical protein
MKVNNRNVAMPVARASPVNWRFYGLSDKNVEKDFYLALEFLEERNACLPHSGK